MKNEDQRFTEKPLKNFVSIEGGGFELLFDVEKFRRSCSALYHASETWADTITTSERLTVLTAYFIG